MTLLDAFLAVLGFFVSPGVVAFAGGVLAIVGIISLIISLIFGIIVAVEGVFFDWRNAFLAAAGALAILLGVTLIVWESSQ